MSETRKEKFGAILKHFDEAMLVTRSAQGALRARPMAIAGCDADRDIWFATGEESGKVDELLRDPQVAVTCQSTRRYLSISGLARVVRDRAKIDELWSDAWKAWFPQGKDDPRLTLVHIRATEAEYWDQTGMKGLRYAFDAIKSMAKGERVQGTEERPDLHGKVQL